MTLEAILESEKKMLVIISLAMIGAGIFADFIVTIVWWSRLHPWFAHAVDDGKIVYSTLTISWVFCLIAIILLALLAIFKFFVPSIYEKIGENRNISILVIVVFGVLSFVIFICTIIPASFGLKNETFMFDDEMTEAKCYRYFFLGASGIDSWLRGQSKSKYYEFEEWYSKLMRHIANEYYDYFEFTNYLCAEVGAPALVFTLILLIGVILFLVVAVPVLKGSTGANDGNSENENPQE